MEFRRIIDVQFKEFDRTIFEKSKEWLEDPEIKRMTNAPDIDPESRERWFQSLKERKDYTIFSVWRDEDPIGVAGFKNKTDIDAEAFLYIGEKQYWGKAIGIDMLKYLVEYGRSIGLSSIYANILKENINSYKLAYRLGFKKEEGLDDDSYLMRYYY